MFFVKKGYWFKIRMEFLRPLFAKIKLICQQPAMPQLSGFQGEPAYGSRIGIPAGMQNKSKLLICFLIHISGLYSQRCLLAHFLFSFCFYFIFMFLFVCLFVFVVFVFVFCFLFFGGCRGGGVFGWGFLFCLFFWGGVVVYSYTSSR